MATMSRVVAITGCDSGLGWAMAARSAREGFVTIAGMHQGTETEAAHALKKMAAHPCQLDVTSTESIAGFKSYVQKLMVDNPSYRLHAVVNNAGVMTIGDFEWQTPAMIENTIAVNLLGPIRIVSAFLPDLRKTALENTGTSKPRIINVASHCGLQPLPGFAVYSASKAAVLAWTRALRREHYLHGLTALAFVPGGFVSSSNIISKQTASGHAMLQHLNEEQKSFYEKKIKALTNHLQSVAVHVPRYDAMNDENIMEAFVKALMQDDPKELYKVESWRYMFYYNLFNMPLPEATLNWLIKKFLTFPHLE